MLHDLVLKGGRVIDPSQGVDRVTDVGFEGGKVTALGDGLAGADERDATGLIVTPGLIDLHTHVYWGGTSLGVEADAYARQSAVTTSVDAGSAGPGNFAGFKAHVIDRAVSRVAGLPACIIRRDIRVLSHHHDRRKPGYAPDGHTRSTCCGP